jgi:hypothetical protein
MAETTAGNSEPARRRTPGINALAFCLLSPLLCLLPAGCAPDDFSSAGDPLVGGPPVRPPSAASAGADRATGAAVPPLPPTNPAASPASLASANRGPLDPNRPDLRIPSSDGVNWQGAGGVALQPPQPVSGGAVPLQPKPAPELQLAGNVTSPTFDQLKAQLRGRGVSVINFKTDLATGETTLTCFAPLKNDPSKQQVHTTKAPDEVSAMRAVLDQIDKAR